MRTAVTCYGQSDRVTTGRHVALPTICFDASSRIGEAACPGPESDSADDIVDARFADPLHGGTAAEFLAEHHEWLFPVVCRDVNAAHQTEVRLFYAPDILDFVRHELCCEVWSEDDLVSALRALIDQGGGTFDPAVIVQGDTDFGTFDHVFGFVPPQRSEVDLRTPQIYATSSRTGDSPVDPHDLVLQELRTVDKTDCSNDNAVRLLRQLQDGHLTRAELPFVQEEMIEVVRASLEDNIRYVGPADAVRTKFGRKKRPKCNPAHTPWSTRAAEVRFANHPQRPSRESEVQPRRCKQGKRACFEMLILNSSGAPQYLAALATCDKEVMVVINQEHQCAGADYTDLRCDADAAGWHLHGAQAVRTKKDGLSAGVSIAVRKTVGKGDVNGKADHSPRVAPGRLSATWVQVGPDTGIVVMSIYLFHSEGLSFRNKKLLEHALATARSYGSPWVIGGDFNMTPDEFGGLFGYALELANAYIFAPSLPTHYPAEGSAKRTLDFLVCSDAAHHWIDKIFVDQGIAASPHRAVRVQMSADRHNFTVSKLSAPKSSPRNRPIGCARAPVIPEWAKRVGGETRDGLTLLGTRGHTVPFQALDGVAWQSLAHAIECELCNISDCVKPDGKIVKSYTGRARGVRIVQRLALPKRSSAQLGKVDTISHALRWFAVRVRELAAVSRKLRDGNPVAALTATQCDRIMAKLAARDGLVSVVRRVSKDWDLMVDSVCNHDPGKDTVLLEKIAQSAEEDAIERKKLHSESRAASWRSHVARQLTNGAATSHRWAKRDGVPDASAESVGSGANRTASPQAIVDQDLVTWKGIWNRPVESSDPWREAVLCDDLPSITGADVRRAARSFRSGTSVGCDAFPPVALSWLSDPLCESIAFFLNTVEEGGKWLEEVATSLIHFIPKPTGGKAPHRRVTDNYTYL